MHRMIGVAAVALVLVAGACSSGVTGTQRYSVGVDAASPAGKNFQYSTFFPSTIKASPGDSITFTNKSTQAPHTVSFGVAADRSNQPPVVLPTGKFNPAVQQPCSSQQALDKSLTQCPNKKLADYDGTGYWNSGVLVPSVAPEGPKRTTLKLSDSIKPGSYKFLCILHGPMAGVLTVVADEKDRDSSEDVVAAGSDELAKARADANNARAPSITEPNTVNVVAGWSGGVTAVNRFSPETVTVKAGESVTWTAASAFEPHTVSFGPNFQSGNESPGFAPSGLKSGSAYTGGEANAGLFGAKGGPFPPGPFTLTFPKAGEYKYVCILHPGMQGTVKVT